MRSAILTLSLMIVFSGASIAQSIPRSNQDWVPVDPEPGSRSSGESVELAGATMLAIQADRAAQETALQILGELVDEGAVTAADADALEIIRSVLGRGVTILSAEGGAGYPIVRLNAVQLLGRLEGEEVRTMLYEVIQGDPEPSVVAEAVRAVSTSPLPPDDRFFAVLTHRIRYMNHVEPDDRLAYAVLEAVLRMRDSAWQVDDPDLYEGLIGIARGDYIARVRRKAVEVLEILRED